MKLFDLTGKVALITGAAGLLGPKHAEAILDAGGQVIISDVDVYNLERVGQKLVEQYGPGRIFCEVMDVTKKSDIQRVADSYEKISILINNCSKDPKVTKDQSSLTPETRFETMTEEYWKEGLDAAVNGTFLCSQVIGNKMLNNGGGNIIMVASDLSIIAPRQDIYKIEGVLEENQPVKPITYSAAKFAIIGMMKYLSIYYAERGIRVNALSPTGVYNNHPPKFKAALENLIPMKSMSHEDDFKAAIIFLCSDASRYMTGHNLVIDGGKTVW